MDSLVRDIYRSFPGQPSPSSSAGPATQLNNKADIILAFNHVGGIVEA